MTNKFDIIVLSFQFDINPEMSGMGYRIWEICQALANNGLRVKIVAPKCNRMSHDNIFLETLNLNKIVKYISEAEVFYINFGAPNDVVNLLKKQKKKIIFDAIMTPIEVLEYQSLRDNASAKDSFFKKSISEYKNILRCADYYLTGSYEEKEIMIGQLLISGKINNKTYKTINNLIDVIPIGYSKEALRESLLCRVIKKTTNKTYVWNGGVWNHYSVSLLLNAIHEVVLQDRNFEFNFLYKSGTDVYKEIECFVKKEKLQNFILLNQKKLDYNTRHATLHLAHAIVVITDESLESHTTLRLRIRDVFLYNKPIIASKYGLLGRFVEKYGIGVVVENNKDQIKKAIINFSRNHSTYNKYVSNIKNIKKRFCYENNVNKLIKYIEDE